MLKKLRFIVLYSLYLLAALALIDYFFFYRPYLGELRAQKGPLTGRGDPDQIPLLEVPNVPPEVMQRLGRMSIEKKSAFAHFEPAKPAGIVRVCAYGDSFAFGDEVGPEHDYPSLLQKRFESAGAHNVQVLNFGVAGFGFHQTYMLWDAVGRGYDCDFTLLGPQGFQPIRDTTFGYILHWPPYYLHARYVLDGDDVRLLEIPGATYGERFKHHFRFIPRWDVLRYDRNPPMFLRALIPRNRELKNPFYYDSRSMDDEAFDTYAILLGKMAAAGERVLVGHYVPEIVDVAREVEASNLAAADFHEEYRFPYRAPVAHASPWGNRLLAEQFFRWLTGAPTQPLEVLATTDVARPSNPSWEPGAPPFGSYTQIAVELAGVPIGAPAIREVDARPGEAALASASALAFKGTEMSLVDACFLPFDGELRPGMGVAIRAAGGAEVRVGTVAALDPRLRLGIVEIAGFQFPDQARLFFRGNSQVAPHQLGSGEVSLLVDGHEMLRGPRGQFGVLDGVSLAPVGQRCRVLRGNGAGLVELGGLAGAGVFELALGELQGDVLRLPIAGWQKVEPAEPPPAPPLLREVLRIGPDGVAQVVPRS